MRKLGDNKAQSSIGIGFFLVLFIGIVGVILIIYFFTDAFERVSDAVKLTPSTIAMMEQLCSGYVQYNSVTGYCNDFKEHEKNQWINCDYVKKNYNAKFEKLEGSNDCTNSMKNKCDELERTLNDTKKFEKQYVNGYKCIDVK